MIEKLPKAVIDTNVLISAACWPRSTPGRAFRQAALRTTLLRSSEVLEEFESVLRRSMFDRYVPLDRRPNFFANFVELAESITVTDRIQARRHPPDDKFLSLAVSGNADFILTGDDDLLALHPFQGIDVLKPTDYLARYAG
ncbi:MAG: putative toxin-antitoxin system toxin component, PIN family [Acidobacteriaceae bacterium]